MRHTKRNVIAFLWLLLLSVKTAGAVTCGSNRVVECGTFWTFDAPLAGDQCDSTNISFGIINTLTNALCGSGYSATRTWEIVDSCSITTQCSQTVIYVDTTPPVITCVSNRFVGYVVWSWELPSVSDLCDGTNVVISAVSTITNQCGFQDSGYQATRRWRATDSCGNSAYCSQTVTVVADPRTPPPEHKLIVGPQYTRDQLAAFGYSVNNAPRDLYRINPRTGNNIKTNLTAFHPLPFGNDVADFGFTYGEGYLWAIGYLTNSGQRALFKMSVTNDNFVQTNTISIQSLPFGQAIAPLSLAYGDGWLWAFGHSATNGGPRPLYKISSYYLGIVQTNWVPFQSSSFYDYDPRGMTYGDGYLWFFGFGHIFGQRPIYKIDPLDGSIVSTNVTSLGGFDLDVADRGLAYGDGYLWSLSSFFGAKRFLFKINSTTGEIEQTIGTDFSFYSSPELDAAGIGLAYIAKKRIVLAANPADAGDVNGAGNKLLDTYLTVRASPRPGYTFLNWTEGTNIVSSGLFEHCLEFKVTRNRSLVANFTLIPNYTISTSVASDVGGWTKGAGTFQKNSYATVVATPYLGFAFSNWTEGGNVVSYAATNDFQLITNRVLVANFTPFTPVPVPTLTVTASSAPSAGGTISGAGTYNSGSYVTVSAFPYVGFTFSNWTAGGSVVSASRHYGFILSSNRTLVANFTPVPTYLIVASGSPGGGGTIYGAGTYNSGSYVTVRAFPHLGFTFSNWTAGGSVGSASQDYGFILSSNRTLVANFTPVPTYSITASVIPGAGGTISGSGTYNSGSYVTVIATPDVGFTLSNWTDNGGVASTSASYSFIATSNRLLVANFTRIVYSVVTDASPGAGGTTSGAGTYNSGSNVTIIATPNSGYTFLEWTEGDSVVSTTTNFDLTVIANHSLVANFLPPSYTIAMSASPSAGGTVSGSGSYLSGLTVIVSATPHAGYTFLNWTENGHLVSNARAYNLIVTSNRTLVARFTQTTINQQPASLDVRVRPDMSSDVAPITNAVFTVTTATSNPPLAYQWQVNGTNITAGTNLYDFNTPALIISNVSIQNFGSYSCMITDSNGTITSQGATLYPLVRPLIWIGPLSQTVPAGSPIAVSVVLSNGFPPPFGYQWRSNSLVADTFVSNLKTNFYVISSNFVATNAISAPYTVVVTNRAAPTPLVNAPFTVTTVMDTDHDGIPDVTEAVLGLGTNNAADALLDLDGDRMSNLAEYRAGTDPANSNNFLRVSLSTVSNLATLSVATVTNRTYTVQYSDKLPATWNNLGSIVARTINSVEILTDPNWITNRFYRVVLPAQP